MTCYQCRHSIGSESGLWCELWRRLASMTICKRFVREMGTEEPENDK